MGGNGMEIRPDLKEVASRRNRFMTAEKVSLLFANGLVLYGMEKPAALQVHELPPGLFRFFLLPILITLYVYLASRGGAYIGRLSRSYTAASGKSEEAPDLFREGRVTLYGRLKSTGEDRSGGPLPHFILEEASESGAPDMASRHLEVSLTPSSQQAETMRDYLGKRLMVAGKVRFNQLRGKQEVIPELVMEVL